MIFILNSQINELSSSLNIKTDQNLDQSQNQNLNNIQIKSTQTQLIK